MSIKQASDLRRSAKTRANRRAKRSSRSWFKIVGIAPFVSFLLVFGAYPLGLMIAMSFNRVRIVGKGTEWSWAGTANYADAFQDSTFGHSLWVTLVFIVCSVIGTLIIGVALALLTEALVRGASLLRYVLIWPAIVTPVVISVLWLLILSPHVGLLNKILISMGLPAQGWLGENTDALLSVAFVDIWHWTPVVYLLVYTALMNIDVAIREAAAIDGASGSLLTRYITLPLLRPAILAAALIRVVMATKSFDEMYLLTGGGPGRSTQLVSLYIREVLFSDLKLGFGSAVSIVVVLIVVVGACVVVAGRTVVGGKGSGR